MKDLGYINIHCPHCGKQIFINITDNVDSENFEEKYNCSCGKNFNIEYDIAMGNININTETYIIDK